MALSLPQGRLIIDDEVLDILVPSSSKFLHLPRLEFLGYMTILSPGKIPSVWINQGLHTAGVPPWFVLRPLYPKAVPWLVLCVHSKALLGLSAAMPRHKKDLCMDALTNLGA